MTDVAGDFGGGPRVTCILKEGNITVSTTGFGQDGTSQQVATVASEVSKDDVVQLSTDTGNTFAATNGMPVVETVASTGGVIGRVVTEPLWVVMPESSQSTWATMLSSKYYRVVTVEFGGFTAVEDVSIIGDTSNAVTPGETATIVYDVSAGEYVTAASGGSGLVALNYVGASAATGTRCLIGRTGGALVSQA
jgi:hypothetical protein